MVTILQGGSVVVGGHMHPLYETIYTLGLFVIPILLLIIELAIKINKTLHKPLS